MKKVRLSGHRDTHFVVARVRTQDGRTAKVLLGTEDRLEQLNLQDGDRVEINGRTGRINDRTVVVADRVHAGDQTVNAMPASRRPTQQARRVRGEVENLETRSFRGKDEEFVVAAVDLGSDRKNGENGVVKKIILGPKSTVESLDLQVGDELSAIVCPCSLNEQQALQAKSIHANGKTMTIDEMAKQRRQRQREQPAAREGRSPSNQRN